MQELRRSERIRELKIRQKYAPTEEEIERRKQQKAVDEYFTYYDRKLDHEASKEVENDSDYEPPQSGKKTIRVHSERVDRKSASGKNRNRSPSPLARRSTPAPNKSRNQTMTLPPTSGARSDSPRISDQKRAPRRKESVTPPCEKNSDSPSDRTSQQLTPPPSPSPKSRKFATTKLETPSVISISSCSDSENTSPLKNKSVSRSKFEVWRDRNDQEPQQVVTTSTRKVRAAEGSKSSASWSQDSVYTITPPPSPPRSTSSTSRDQQPSTPVLPPSTRKPLGDVSGRHNRNGETGNVTEKQQRDLRKSSQRSGGLSGLSEPFVTPRTPNPKTRDKLCDELTPGAQDTLQSNTDMTYWVYIAWTPVDENGHRRFKIGQTKYIKQRGKQQTKCQLTIDWETPAYAGSRHLEDSILATLKKEFKNRSPENPFVKKIIAAGQVLDCTCKTKHNDMFLTTAVEPVEFQWLQRWIVDMNIRQIDDVFERRDALVKKIQDKQKEFELKWNS